MKNKAGHRILSILLTLALLLVGLPVTAFAEDSGDAPAPDGEVGTATTGTTKQAGVTFSIPEGEYGTAFYLPENEPLTEADLLAGVTAVDENGGNVTVTVGDVDGLDMQNPKPQMTGWMNKPYTITYAAAHPVSGDEFTETRECYVTAAVAAPTGIGTQADPCTTSAELQAALGNPPQGGTIYVDNITSFARQIDIPNGTNVTIEGVGGNVTLTATALIRHFQLSSGTATLTFTDVTLDGNNTGGGITNYGALTLNGVTIENCDISGSGGGGIYTGGSLTLNDVTISNCCTSNSGGGIYNNSGTLTINNSAITDNKAKYGGGIYVSNNSTVTITGSTVSGNTATTSGDAICNDGTVNIDSSCTVSGGIENTNILNNSGTITIPSGQSLLNSLVGGRYGTLNNNGAIIIDSGGTFDNQSNCTVNNNSGGVITNNGTVTNNGTINNYPGGTLNNVSGGTINQIPPPPPPLPPPTTPDSSSNFGGSSSGNTTTAAKTAPTPATKQEALDAFNKALSSLTPGQTTVTVRFVNCASIPPDVLKALADAAKKAGVTVIIHADTVSDGAVQTRLCIDPAKSAKEITLTASMDSPDAVNATSRFKSRFANKLTAVSTGQQGSFGQPVKIAAKVDLSGMDTENLVFYSYDSKTNSYKRIENPDYWIDKKGYLHFTTELAGDIIISDGELEKKS